MRRLETCRTEVCRNKVSCRTEVCLCKVRRRRLLIRRTVVCRTKVRLLIRRTVVCSCRAFANRSVLVLKSFATFSVYKILSSSATNLIDQFGTNW